MSIDIVTRISLDEGSLCYVHDEEFNMLVVGDLVVRGEKRKGTGTALLDIVKRIASSYPCCISLVANPIGDEISAENLAAFYRSNGFVLDVEECDDLEDFEGQCYTYTGDTECINQK